jgi:hypothetical protein
MTDNPNSHPSCAVSSSLGGLVSWVAGKDSVRRGRSPLDGALGELLSWITGRGGRKDLRVQRTTTTD